MRIILIIAAIVFLTVGILGVSPLFSSTLEDNVFTISMINKNY
jgi:uncharacterized membrane protein YbaN (DUF454 family)